MLEECCCWKWTSKELNRKKSVAKQSISPSTLIECFCNLNQKQIELQWISEEGGRIMREERRNRPRRNSYPCCRNSKIKCLHVRKRDLFEFVNWSIGVSMKRSTHTFCFSWPENVHPRQVLIKLIKSGKQTSKGVRSAFRPRFYFQPCSHQATPITFE